MAKGLLIRVGMDSTCAGGKGHSFCKENGEFYYLPIPEDKKNCEFESTYKNSYQIFEDTLQDFTSEAELPKQPCHLDPDFECLTYGDTKTKAQRIRDVFLENSVLHPDSFIAFYSALKLIDSVNKGKLIYALIGFYRIEAIKNVSEVLEADYYKNAHTRYVNINPKDVIVYAANDKTSGRFKTFIHIGDYREKAYRVKEDLLKKWGGLSVNNGYIQRSIYLPEFKNAEMFLEWMENEAKPEIIQKNNPYML